MIQHVILLLSVASAAALTYEGQSYGMTISKPSADSPWYTGGYNTIDSYTIQTLICCPPLPPVAWVLRNDDKSLLGSDLYMSTRDANFTAPVNPEISSARPGGGYILCAVLGSDPSQSFGCSGKFEILEGSLSPPIVTSSGPIDISPPLSASTGPVDPDTPTGTVAPGGPHSPLSSSVSDRTSGSGASGAEGTRTSASMSPTTRPSDDVTASIASGSALGTPSVASTSPPPSLASSSPSPSLASPSPSNAASNGNFYAGLSSALAALAAAVLSAF